MQGASSEIVENLPPQRGSEIWGTRIWTVCQTRSAEASNASIAAPLSPCFGGMRFDLRVILGSAAR